MGKLAALFPGQGSQYVGMAKELYDFLPEVRERYRTAQEVLGFDLAKASFEGPEDFLVQTKCTQPAIFVHSCIVYDLAVQRGFSPDFCAGHSLGEYSALYAAGVLNFQDALFAVGKRAEFMQLACEKNPGAMAAVLNLDFSMVEDVCRQVDGIVTPANHNSPSQLAISGSRAAVEQASILLKEKGARRVMPLPVGGAFHSPLMEPAPQELADAIKDLEFSDAQMPVVPNVTGEGTTDAGKLKELLVRQITSPVLWYPSLLWLQKQGTTSFVELGPKQVLSGLVKKSLKDIEINHMETLADIENNLSVTA